MANSQNLIGKVAIVTGSSSGIGAATAIRLATYGAQVVINGRNQEKLEKVYQQCKIASQKGNFKITNPVIQVIGDVTDDEICQNLVKTTIEKFGKIDILVNNAGNSFPTSIYDPNLLEEYDNLMNLNVRSVIVLTQLVVPHLEKTKGVIVNVSSIASIKPLMPIYSMSKAALDMFTKSLALELGPKGIRVNGVNPGPINTQLFDSLFKGLPIEMKSKIIEEMGKTMTLERLGQPEEIAKHITFLASDDSSFITGTCLIDDGGAMWMMKT